MALIRHEDADENVWLRYWKLGIDAHQKGELAVAERLLRAGVVEAEALGPNDPRLASSLTVLADVLREQSRFAETQPLLERAMQIYEQHFGASHPSTVEVMQQLSTVYEQIGQHALAEDVEKRLLAIEQQALGNQAPEVARTLQRLASLCSHQSKLAQAEQYYHLSLTISEAALGPHHADVGRTLSNLASVRMAQGKASEAESLLRRALKILETAVGADTAEVAQVTEALGAAIRATDPAWVGLFEGTPPSLPTNELETSGDRFVGAFDDTDETISVEGDIFEDVLQDAHEAFDQGDFGRAERKYRLAVSILERSGQRDARLAYCHLNLGRVLGARGSEPEIIKPPVKEALRIAEGLDTEHPVVASCCVTLATLAYMARDFNRAKKYWKRAIPILTEVHGKDHAKVGIALCDLAGAYRQLKKLDEAYAHYLRALIVLRKQGQPPELLEAIHGCAQTCRAQGKHEEAEGLYRETLEMLEQLYGADHAELVEPLREYSAVLTALGKSGDAAEFASRAACLAARGGG